MKRHLFFAAAVAGLFAGCTEVTTQRCYEQGVGLRFPDFTTTDLDTVVIRKFAPRTGFSELRRADTLAVDSIVLARLYDTFFWPEMTPDSSIILRSGSDYEVVVLKTGTTTRISEILLEGQTQVSDRHHVWTIVDLECVNGIRAFVQDGQPFFFGPDDEYGGVFATVRR